MESSGERADQNTRLRKGQILAGTHGLGYRLQPPASFLLHAALIPFALGPMKIFTGEEGLWGERHKLETRTSDG